MKSFASIASAILTFSILSCGTTGIRQSGELPQIRFPVANTADFHDYNRSLSQLFSAMLREYKPGQLKGTVDWHGTKIRFDGGRDELTLLDPSEFDDIQIIENPEGDDQVNRPARRDGLGVPLVMMQQFRKEKSSPTKLFPLNGRHLPATLVAEPAPNGTLVLKFHHTRNVQDISFAGRKHDLAYDLTTPLHRSMDGRFNGNMALPGLIDSNRYLDDTGIYVPDVHDPAKIPVVFVHGIKSDPHIWENAMNEVLLDPELRRKYQCWYFLYPTGLPIYASAAKLRRMLYLARNYYDPSHHNPRMNRMVLVGHSMGGILSRMQAIDSGSDIYDAAFVTPLKQLPVQDISKQFIEESMYFERVPFVNRVVFVATPHQGSSMAQIPVVKAVSMLVHPTRSLDTITVDVRTHAMDSLNPKLREFKNFGTRSTQTLSPEHPLIGALQKRRIQVPYHTVLAAKKSDANPWNTTDGIVAYWSSHISGAQSEKIVAGNHSCTRLPGVADEILRILRAHAN